MVRQARTYLVGALSGVTLIGAAIVVFVVLVSAQVFHEWPIAEFGGHGQSPRSSPGKALRPSRRRSRHRRRRPRPPPPAPATGRRHRPAATPAPPPTARASRRGAPGTLAGARPRGRGRAAPTGGGNDVLGRRQLRLAPRSSPSKSQPAELELRLAAGSVGLAAPPGRRSAPRPPRGSTGGSAPHRRRLDHDPAAPDTGDHRQAPEESPKRSTGRSARSTK